MAFWSREVVNKALLFITRVKQPADLTNEGTALELNPMGVAKEQVVAETGLATLVKVRGDRDRLRRRSGEKGRGRSRSQGAQ
eukprot:14872287-Alexandrium_andersonii.AAC.1